MKSNASIFAVRPLRNTMIGAALVPVFLVNPAAGQDGASSAGASYAQPGSGPVTAPTPVPTTSPVTFAPAQQPAVSNAHLDPAANATGPAGSSQSSASRYDVVTLADVRPLGVPGRSDDAIVALHRTLPERTVLEMTALDSGKTILVLVVGRLEGPGDTPLAISPGAARLLDQPTATAVAVRHRRIVASASDQAALHQGQPATRRPNAPPILLTALRKLLPAGPMQPVANATVPAPPAPATPPVAAPPSAQPVANPVSRPAPAAVPAGKGYFVQVAALSNAKNAQSLAQSMKGFVKPGSGLYRVQIGPFATRAEADAARKRAAGAGYGDARVFAN